jgi:hypothetical protein
MRARATIGERLALLAFYVLSLGGIGCLFVGTQGWTP